MLWVCLLFPSLPLDVFARVQAPAEGGRPFVVASGGHYPRVVAANAQAQAAGIRAGQLISSALALEPDLVLRDRNSESEAQALAQLATWTLSFTPGACLAPPDGVLAEIGGSLRLFGGLPRLVAHLTGGSCALGYTPRLGIAATPGAALLLARAGQPQPIVQRAQLPAALAPLPLTLLDFDDTARATLREAGITTFGDVAALPRDGLARRFGAPLVALIDRTLGRAADPRAPFVPPPHFARRLELPAPAHDIEALNFGVYRLVQEFSAWLAARGLGVMRLALTLGHEHYLRQRGLADTVVPFALGAPARTPTHLLGVLRERLARVQLPAPVETLLLASEETAPLAGCNLGLLPGDQATAVDVPLIDRLRARLGEDAVVRLALHAEHRPERAMRDVGIAAVGAKPGSGKSRRRAANAPLQPPDPAPDSPRPLWLLAQPQPLAHVFEAQPWVLHDGPERIESGWWDGGDVRRDYFVARSPAGETAWIYRDHRYGTDDGEWFLHGWFA